MYDHIDTTTMESQGKTFGESPLLGGCLCFGLRRSTQIIAFVDLVISAICVIGILVLSVSVEEKLEQFFSRELWKVLSWLVVRGLFSLIASLFLINGIIKVKRTINFFQNRRLLYIPWLFWTPVSLIVGFAGLLSVAVELSDSEFFPSYVVTLLLVVGLALAAGSVCYIIVYSHFKVLLYSQRSYPLTDVTAPLNGTPEKTLD
ncbi:unnamed protein product [Cyprideis torosa]|uniref:Uncharacterized protein n=1 Tax=Cyprideis torosa TaxID=163714 RepID=A0A7R8WIN7_9CRUS|nr:unnamed protein product [Cyprideis torosa]CAG0894906.1 unnamed protein product [Cyprideis torosa]